MYGSRLSFCSSKECATQKLSRDQSKRSTRQSLHQGWTSNHVSLIIVRTGAILVAVPLSILAGMSFGPVDFFAVHITDQDQYIFFSAKKFIEMDLGEAGEEKVEEQIN